MPGIQPDGEGGKSRHALCIKVPLMNNRGIRIVLWTIAILAPGGFVLLPLLAGEALVTRAGRADPSPQP